MQHKLPGGAWRRETIGGSQVSFPAEAPPERCSGSKEPRTRQGGDINAWRRSGRETQHVCPTPFPSTAGWLEKEWEVGRHTLWVMCISFPSCYISALNYP
ncbi:UNVERIFIED_CONTAM: hypothetical protein K2H54_067044 [Gekko kuhli]